MEEIVTGDAVVLDLPCARFPTRMLAHLIDMLVQVLLLIIVAVVGVAITSGVNSAWGATVLVAGFVLVIVGYPVTFETLSRGKTLGKVALGQRVVGDDGSPERFRQALVRGLAGAVECWILFGVPALIASMFSSRGKRLGDIFAGTFALHERAPRPAIPGGIVPPMTPALTAWAVSLDLSALPDGLAASAAGYLTRYQELHSPAREQLGAQLAAGIAARVLPPPPPGLPPVYFLGVVLAERRRREYARLTAPSSSPLPGPAWGPVPGPAWGPVPGPAWGPVPGPVPGSARGPVPGLASGSPPPA